MTSRKLKYKVRRQILKTRRQVENLGLDAGDRIDRNFVTRLNRLASVRRFVASWILLLVLIIGSLIAQTRALSGLYQNPQPEPGGVYNEGILGDFTNANPVYATGTVDSAISRLVFSSLLTYNSQNVLVGDLAKSWTVNSTGNLYTVYLKPNLFWQDGRRLTAADVVFTYQVIQNADAQSPLETNFQGITVAAPNSQTVTFSLPNPLSSFPQSLTNGIIPQHLLSNIPMAEMRSANFDTLDPVGSGPFEFKGVEVAGSTPQTRLETIELAPFLKYYNGVPKLSEFVIHAFHDQNALITSFNKGQLNGLAGLSYVPSNLKIGPSTQIDNFPLTAAVMTFFKTSAGVLSDVNVRKALVTGANQLAIMSGLSYPSIAVREPLLQNQLGYNSAYAQASYNPILAGQELTNDGWVLGQDGIRYKDGAPLSFTLTASNDPEFSFVAITLQQEWRSIGVNVQLSLQDVTDLQNSVNYHSYDAIIYGISIGVDPDVFVYWDSSQADPRSPTRLNLSEYKSTTADDALEQGRTRDDPALRVIKYAPFLAAWQQDAPALGLYQPRFLYVINGQVSGLEIQTLNSGTDRYNNVQNWEIRQKKVDDRST